MDEIEFQERAGKKLKIKFLYSPKWASIINYPVNSATLTKSHLGVDTY